MVIRHLFQSTGCEFYEKNAIWGVDYKKVKMMVSNHHPTSLLTRTISMNVLGKAHRPGFSLQS